MKVFRFRHPGNDDVYIWNLEEGLLYRNSSDPFFLDRSTEKGRLLFHFLKFGKINNAEMSFAKTYVPRLMNDLDPLEKDRERWIKTIRGFGYEWLPKVEIIEDETDEGDLWEDVPPIDDSEEKAPLFLNKVPAKKFQPFLERVIDSTTLVREKTRDFVGRDYVFAKIDEFLEHNEHGYLIIRGDPGIGKTALMARLVVQRRYAHHFNIRSEGISRTALFLRNLCAQLIVKYNLGYTEFPPEATYDASFLKEILEKISANLSDDEHAVILVDALDEAEISGSGANTLFLPQSLPEGIFIVATTRRTDEVKLHFDCTYDVFDIRHDDAGNIRDIVSYIEKKVDRPEMVRYVNNQNLSRTEFVALLEEKSEGNFIYLRYVLPEIEIGAYRNRSIDDVPKGLHSYYEDHWWRMRGMDEVAWLEFKLPVVLALTIVQQPVSVAMISRFSKVPRDTYIQHVLRGWRQFLHVHLTSIEQIPEKRYRIYHTSYQDFIHHKDEVQEMAAEKGVKREIDLKDAHRKIADTLVKDLIDAGVLDDDFDSLDD